MHTTTSIIMLEYLRVWLCSLDHLLSLSVHFSPDYNKPCTNVTINFADKYLSLAYFISGTQYHCKREIHGPLVYEEGLNSGIST